MKSFSLLLGLLTFMAIGLSTPLQAQKVENGYTVKSILINAKAVKHLEQITYFQQVATIKISTIYPKEGYKIVAVQNGASAAIVPTSWKVQSMSLPEGRILTRKSRLLCGCDSSLPPSCRVEENSVGEYDCDGSCNCNIGILLPDINDLLQNPAEVQNPEGTNEWPYTPHGW